MAAYDRRDLSKGAAVQTTLNGGISSGATSGVLTATTGWPDGSPGAFYVVVDPGLTTEEKILCSTRSSTTLNFTTRGADGTSAAAHASGAVIYPCLAAVDLDEANLAVAKTLKLATAAGQILVVDAANSFAAVQAKTSGQILVGNGTTLASVAVSGDATLASTGALTVAANAVTNAKLAGMTRGTVKVGNAAGAASDLAIGTAGYYLGSDGTDVAWTVFPARPLGKLGLASITTGQGSITSAVDVTSATATVTVTAGHTIKITCFLGSVTATSNADIILNIFEGATRLANGSSPVLSTSGGVTVRTEAVLAPSTGSHTYKAQITCSAGTGTINASATAPSFFLVEDIGT